MIHFDIDVNELKSIGDELGASEKQIKLAFSRALQRTASKLRMLSTKGLKSELQLQRVSALRKRLKTIRLRRGMEGIQLWYGLNDMPISWFKGTPTQTPTGAQFRGVEYPHAFVASSRYAKGKTILKRKGKSRLAVEEQLYPVKDKADVFIEDKIFVELESIFWPLFRRELAARVKYQIGAA
jgi:hypothetical protein